MKLLISLALAVITTFAVSERPSIALQPMGWSTSTLTYTTVYKVATSKDLLVYGENLEGPTFTILRRDSDGYYNSVGAITGHEIIYGAITNGKWIAVFDSSGRPKLVNPEGSTSGGIAINSQGGYILNDDTYVGYGLNNGNYTIQTYQYESTNNTWNSIPGTELAVNRALSFYRATDTHLVFTDYTSNKVQIYSRQANKSWKLEESVTFNNTFSGYDKDVNYNGIDTLTVVALGAKTTDNDTGILFVYTKVNGQWNEQTFTTSSVGYRSEGYLGAVTTFISPNTLLVAAPLEGVISELENPTNSGKVLLLTRNNDGVWEPSLDFSHPSAEGVWGRGIGVNDYDIIVPNLVPDTNRYQLTFYTIPSCPLQQISMTCYDIQLDDCSQLDVNNVSLSSLYTINNNVNCNVTMNVDGVSLVNNRTIEATFSFTKSDQSASCTSTVTCPAPVPPVATQEPSVTPSPSTQTPSVAQAPLKEKSPSVSGATVLELGFVALFTVIVSH